MKIEIKELASGKRLFAGTVDGGIHLYEGGYLFAPENPGEVLSSKYEMDWLKKHLLQYVGESPRKSIIARFEKADLTGLDSKSFAVPPYIISIDELEFVVSIGKVVADLENYAPLPFAENRRRLDIEIHLHYRWANGQVKVKTCKTHEEAVQVSLQLPWKIGVCNHGESCWCRTIELESPIHYEAQDNTGKTWEEKLTHIVPQGTINEAHANHIVSLHNYSLIKPNNP